MFLRLTSANVARVWLALLLWACLSAGGCLRHEPLGPGLRDSLPDWAGPTNPLNKTAPWGVSRESRQIEQNLGVR
jgi:hypothetical protein